MARPARVLHVLAGATGGAARSAIALMRVLERTGISAAAISADFGDEAVRAELAEATQGRVAYAPLYWWNKKIRAARWKRPLLEARQIARTGWGRASAINVARLALQHGADLIHTNSILIPDGGRAARLLGLPHVWHVRELVGPDQPFRLPLEGAALGRHLMRRASKVVANSFASAERLRAIVAPELLEVIPNGIDLSLFTRGERAGGPVVVAMVGSLSSRSKKHALFLEAAARLPPDLPVELRIYGDDPSAGGARPGDTYVDALHARARSPELGARLSFRGYVPRPERIMAEIDLLVQPTDVDSFGRVVVEAMAAKLPVVGVRGGGVAEIVRDQETGLLVAPDDPVALAGAIIALVQNPELRARYGDAGRARAEACYSLEACATAVLHVYEQAMARPLGWRS